jgi:hypothetical protein
MKDEDRLILWTLMWIAAGIAAVVLVVYALWLLLKAIL